MEFYIDTGRRNPRFDKVRDSFFLVRWLQIHAFINVFRSLSHRIKESELFNLSKAMWPETNIDKFKVVRRLHPEAGLLSLIFRHFIFWEYMWAGILAILAAALGLVGPLAIKQIVTFLNKDEYDPELRRRADLYGAFMLLAYFARIFLVEFSNRMFFMTSLKVDQVLTSELLYKVSRMSFEKKAKTQKVYLANHMIIDCKFVSQLIASSGTLFSLPFTLVMIQILLFAQVEYFGFSFTLSFLIGLGIQSYIDSKITTKQNQRLGILREKSGANYEFVRAIQQIETMGWQEVIINKNGQFRQRQNEVNSKIYKLQGYFNLVTALIPIVTVFITLALYTNIHDNQLLDPVVVFTIISYCRLITNLNDLYEPLEGFRALNRIQNQLKTQEGVSSQTFDQTLEKGKLVLTKLTAKWRFIGVSLENIEDVRLLEKEEFNFESDESEDQSQQHLPLVEEQVTYLESQEGLLESLLPRQIHPAQSPSQQKQRVARVRTQLSNRFQQLQIPNDLILEKGRIIVVGDVESGKSSFLHTIMGNLSIVEGSAKYGGKIGYMPQNIWFRLDSVRNNIVFGSEVDNKWLKVVYEWLDLSYQLKLLDRGDQTLMDQNLFLTQKQRKKITLARAIYCRPDILILDQPFLFIDNEASTLLYNRLCQYFADKVIIIATKTPQFVRPDDSVLIISDGTIIESGKYQTIRDNPQSMIHKIFDPNESKINIVSTESKQLTVMQRKKRVKRLKRFKQKMRSFVKRLLELTKGKTREQIDKILEEKCGVQVEPGQNKEDQQLKERLPTVKYSYLKRLFLIYPSYYVFLIMISVLIQSLAVYSMYWIGSDDLPFPISYRTQLLVYFGFTLFHGLFWTLSGLLVPRLSKQIVNQVVSKVTRAIAYMQERERAKQGYLIPTLTLNKKIEWYFSLNLSIQHIIYGYITFLISVILVGVTSPIFYVVGVGVAIIYGVARHYLLRAQRQLYFFQYFQYPINQIYQQTITGAETLRAFGKFGEHLDKSRDILYDQSVYRANRQFIFHAISIVCKLLGLGIVAAAVFFAISAKGKLSDYSVGLLGASISYILDLSNILSDVVQNSVELSNLITDTIEDDFKIIDESAESAYFYPEKPKSWPVDGSIQFKNAYLTNRRFDEPVVKDINLRVESGEEVALFGNDDTAKKAIIYSLIRNYDNSNQEGFVKIASVSVQDIGMKFLNEEVKIISSDPFVFRGTVRENVDPFNEYSENQIEGVLKKTRAWNRLKTEPGHEVPGSKLSQQFTQMSRYGLVQRINISRILLLKPKIVIFSSITDSLSRKSANFLETLIMEEFKTCTKIYISQNRDSITKADKVAIIQKGLLKDYGPPIQILNRKYKITANKEQQVEIKEQMALEESRREEEKENMESEASDEQT